MKTVLIIGASRGLGREFAQQYRNENWKVIATIRDTAHVRLLSDAGVQVIPLNVAQAEDFAALKTHIAPLKIDLCIYNAGVYGPSTEKFIAPSDKDFDEVMHTNVLGAMRAIPVVAPCLAKSGGTFAFISSMMGSIAKIGASNGALYRASKAALNATVKAAAQEWGPQGVTLFTLHPGWVKTDMGGSNAQLDPAASIAAMRKVIAQATAQSNGKFFNYDGKELPW